LYVSTRRVFMIVPSVGDVGVGGPENSRTSGVQLARPNKRDRQEPLRHSAFVVAAVADLVRGALHEAPLDAAHGLVVDNQDKPDAERT
jgi:hypothetical protein